MKLNKQFGASPVMAMALGVVFLMSIVVWADAPPQAKPKSLEDKIHHEIVMLPFYSVFDNIEYTVSGDTVTLEGQVIRPTLKSDVEHAVGRIPGVGSVVNNIEVLPPLSFDESIRLAEFRTIYRGSGPLSGYGWGPVPAIHIIVDHGHVTLTGVVHRQVDKDMATLLAKEVPNVFSVENKLIVR